MEYLQKTDNGTLYTYAVYEVNWRDCKYVMKRWMIGNKRPEPVMDESFEMQFNDFEHCHNNMLRQGFIPFIGNTDEGGNIVIEYI